MIALKECFYRFPGNIYDSLESEKASAHIFLGKTFLYNCQSVSTISKGHALTSGKISLQMLSTKVWR